MPPLAPTTNPAGDYVRQLRERYGDTQTDFAVRIGSTQATVSRVEKGTGSYANGLTPEFAWKLVSRLGIDAKEVAGFVDSPGCLSRFIVQAVGSRAQVLTFPPRLRTSHRALESPPVVRRHAASHGAGGAHERGIRLHNTPTRPRLRRPHSLRIQQMDTAPRPLEPAA